MKNIKTFEYFKNKSFKIGDHVFITAKSMFTPGIIVDITNSYRYFDVKTYDTDRIYYCRVDNIKKMTRK